MELSQLYPKNCLISSAVGSLAATAVTYAAAPYCGLDRRAAAVVIATFSLLYAVFDPLVYEGIQPILLDKFFALAPAKLTTEDDKNKFSWNAFHAFKGFLYPISLLLIAKVAQKAATILQKGRIPWPFAQCIAIGVLAQQGINYPLQNMVYCLLQEPSPPEQLDG